MSKANQFFGHSPLLHAAIAGLFAVCAGQAQAITAVTLCAEAFQRTEAPAGVTMWGYRQVANASQCATGSGATAPGPVISVPQGSDRSLAVTLVNRLNVPTSLVLAAQNLPLGGAPVMATDVVDAPSSTVCVPGPSNLQECRVRSFTSETAPGATRTYVFNELRAGTYLYQSGTHPQVQIQMGLAGMAVVGNDTPAGVDEDVPVVLSEIDPAMHASIAALLGTGEGTAWKAGGNSTLKYAPSYFMVNGKVYAGVAAGVAATDLGAVAAPGSVVRLRIANAGLATRVLSLNSGTWKVMGEDGYSYPAPRVQASLMVPAGKTTDADVTLSTATGAPTLALFDRRDGTESAGGTSLSGQVARVIRTDPSTTPSLDPIASQIANEGTTFRLRILGNRIGANSGFTFSVAGLAGATVGNDPVGDLANHRWISWTVPAGNPAPETYAVTVHAINGATDLTQSFNLRVNHAPPAPTGGSFAATSAPTPGSPAAVVASGNVLGAATTDGDGDALSTFTVGTPLAGLSLQPNGSFTWSGTQTAAAQDLTFDVKARDLFNLPSATATTVHITVPSGNAAPVAQNGYSAAAPRVIDLRNGSALQRVQLSFQTTAPSPLQLPYVRTGATATTGVVDATDTDGSVVPTTFQATVTRVNDAGTDIALGSSPSVLVANWTEATATVDASGTVVNFKPRSGTAAFGGAAVMVFQGTSLLGTCNTTCLNGNGSIGKYRITYTVKDNLGAVSNSAVVYVNVTP